jgi:hypothetical protein
MVVVCVFVQEPERRVFFIVQVHVPSKNFIEEKSGLALVGIGVVSIPGVASANAIAVDASAVTTTAREIRNKPERMRSSFL